MFLEDVLVKMLDSANTSYLHRELSLLVLESLFRCPRVMLEIFVNFDCTVSSASTASKIVETISRIAQGKYTRPEFLQIIDAQQESLLRAKALSCLVELIKGLTPFSILSEELPDSSTTQLSNSDSDLIQSNAYFSSPHSNVSHLTPQRLAEKEDSSFTFQSNSSGQEGMITEFRRKKKLIEKCIDRFNYKNKEGLRLFFDEGIIPRPSSLEKTPALGDDGDDSVVRLWETAVTSLADILFTWREQINRV